MDNFCNAALLWFGLAGAGQPCQPCNPCQIPQPMPAEVEKLAPHQPTDLILATALLVAPPGSPEPVPAKDRWPAVRSALVKTALDMEIMDEREQRYMLARVEDFDGDLNLLRRRYVDLADAPRLQDIVFLPNNDVLSNGIKANREFNKTLEQRALWEQDRASLISVVIKENNQLYRVWDKARDSHCGFYYVTIRRAAMKQLKEMVGDDVFYGREDFPPYLPEWRIPNGY